MAYGTLNIDNLTSSDGGVISPNINSLRNRIINGAMVIDQRNAGASFTTGSSAYGIDRWLFQTVGATGTAQQVAGNTGNNKAIKITGAASITTYLVSQRIESVNIYDCASQTVAVSFTLSGSASGSVSVRFLYPTATDNYTTTTEPVAGTTVNFTTTPTQYTVTQSLSTNANKGVWVVFDFGAVGASVTRTLEFTQLEKGSTATSFDYRPYGTELALCQRYYYRNKPGAVSGFGSGLANTTGSTIGFISFPVTMRSAPTALEQSGTASDYTSFRRNGSVACTSVPTFTYANVQGCMTTFTTTGDFNQGEAIIQMALTSSSYLGWSAEL